MQVVTACNQKYLDDGRLQNLVGSVHHWEPDDVKLIVFYDLGLSEAGKREVATWRGVEVRDIPAVVNIGGDGAAKVVPKEAKEATKYAFKPVVIWDALQRSEAGAVLWIDAGAELRRPLDGIRAVMAKKGHFLIEHPYAFPNRQFHHPQTLEMLGCSETEASRQHCATTLVGIVRGSVMER